MVTVAGIWVWWILVVGLVDLATVVTCLWVDLAVVVGIWQ